MKHLKTPQELNETLENLNISDVSDSLTQIKVHLMNITGYFDEMKANIKDVDKLKRIEKEYGNLVKFLSKEIDGY